MLYCRTRQYAQIFHQQEWQSSLQEEISHICVHQAMRNFTTRNNILLVAVVQGNTKQLQSIAIIIASTSQINMVTALCLGFITVSKLLELAVLLG